MNVRNTAPIIAENANIMHNIKKAGTFREKKVSVNH
jgi:hypothetical protein